MLDIELTCEQGPKGDIYTLSLEGKKAILASTNFGTNKSFNVPTMSSICSDIYSRLESRESLVLETKMIGTENVAMICLQFFGAMVEEYIVNIITNILISRKYQPSVTQIMKFIFNRSIVKSYITPDFKQFYNITVKTLNSEMARVIETLLNGNKTEINLDSDIWRIWVKSNGPIKLEKVWIYFTDIKNSELKMKMKEYFINTIDIENISERNEALKLRKDIRFAVLAMGHFHSLGIKSLAKISLEDIESLRDKYDQYGTHTGPYRITRIIFDYYENHSNKIEKTISVNPFKETPKKIKSSESDIDYPCEELIYKGEVVSLSFGSFRSLCLSKKDNPSNSYRGIIESIDVSLNGSDPLSQVVLLGPKCLVEICEKYFPGRFYDYAKKMAAKFTERREHISFSNLQKAIFTKFISNPDITKKLAEIVLNEESIQKIRFPLENKFDLSNVIWIFYWLKGDNLNWKTYDFGQIKNAQFRICVMKYAQHQIKTKKVKAQCLNLYVTLVPALNYFTDKFPEATDLSLISHVMVRSFLHHFEFDYEPRNKSSKTPGKKGFSPKLLHRALRDCYGLTEYFMSQPRKLPKSHPLILENNFGKFHFNNIDAHVSSTVDIPEEVIEQISTHEEELPSDIRRVFNVMMGTGLRVSEAVSLELDWLEYNKTHQIHTLKYIPWKTLKIRLKKGLGEYNTICIADTSVVTCIKDQIDSVSTLRDASGFQQIFLRQHSSRRNNITILNPSAIIRAINKLIIKHDIQTHGGVLWEFSNHQTRKSVAIQLTENGASTSQIRQQFAYLCDDTVEKIYSEVRDKKMAELNHNFFEKKFRILLGDKVLAQYSVEQRRQLYVEFCLGYREVEFGVCVKHMGDGFCEKRCDTEIICAECHNLCTGSKYRDKWVSLFDSQDRLVNELEAAYSEAKIPHEIFETFREYQLEMHKLLIYKDKLTKIDARV